ncbi:MAG: hypothetical protein J6Q32_03345 [Clostridia bacterium]|nr:hypothetical protein [Clostridia bacterium]
MTIKSVVKTAAVMLKKECAVKYLETNEVEQDALETVDILTRCASLVINELACSYIPLVKEEEIVEENGKIYFSSLSDNPLKIIDVLGEENQSVSFAHKPEYIVAKSKAKKIRYSYSPSNFNLEDKTGYLESDVPERVIAYGVAAEYCLIVHAFTESVNFHKRFIESIEEIVKPKNFTTKGRVFI